MSFQYQLREAKDRDFAFYKDLHQLSYKKYVEQIWGWNQADQDRNSEKEFRKVRPHIVQYNGQNVGVLQIESYAEYDFISNILILPSYQNRGIGTSILQDLIEKAFSDGKYVRLNVLKLNPAQKLYERLGFVIDEEGEHKFFMKKMPEEVS